MRQRSCKPQACDGREESAMTQIPDAPGAARHRGSTPASSINRAMAISSQDVLHVARLANLSLSDEEVARMSEQLSGILDHVEALSRLDLDGVAPTAHVLEVENVTRADVSRPSW